MCICASNLLSSIHIFKYLQNTYKLEQHLTLTVTEIQVIRTCSYTYIIIFAQLCYGVKFLVTLQLKTALENYL